MEALTSKPLKLFYCYAREDKAFRDELDRHLSNVKRKYHITSWSDREIVPGTEWQKAIDTQLNTAHLIFLLISVHFMASDYCYSVEMDLALKHHQTGLARVIPIVLSSVDWEDAPFSVLHVLPTDAKPIDLWPNRNQAYLDIVQGVRKAVREISCLLETKEWEEKGNALVDLKRYEEALAAYEQAILLNPSRANAWDSKGRVLGKLKRYEEALAAFELAIGLDANHADAWDHKGMALGNLKRYEEALAAFEQAILLNPSHANAWCHKGATFHNLKQHEEALVAYEQAILLNPNDAYAHSRKDSVLSTLKRHECERHVDKPPLSSLPEGEEAAFP